MFSVRRERDHLTLAILAFLMVLAAAVLTVDSVFLFSFAVFMLMAVATLYLMEMRRSGHLANIHARHSARSHEHRHLAFRAGCASCRTDGDDSALRRGFCFSSCPVCRPANWADTPSEQTSPPGSAITCNWDRSARSSSQTPWSCTSRLMATRPVATNLHWRGDRSGEIRWAQLDQSGANSSCWLAARMTVLPCLVQIWPGKIRDASERHGKIYPLSRLDGADRHQCLLPCAVARSVNGEYRHGGRRCGRSGLQLRFAALHQPLRSSFGYCIASGAQLRSAGRNYPPVITATYLQAPADRCANSAAGRTNHRSAKNDYDKAAPLRIPAHELRLHPATAEDSSERSHCQLPVRAQARTLRILCVVHGGDVAQPGDSFARGQRISRDEFNDITESYVVRAKERAFLGRSIFPRIMAGRRSIPQPPARRAVPATVGHGWHSTWTPELVLAQSGLSATTPRINSRRVRPPISGSRNLWSGSRNWARQKYESMLRWERRKRGSSGTFSRPMGVGCGAQSSWEYCSWPIWDGSSAACMKMGSAHPERSPEQAASIWYERMARASRATRDAKIESTNCRRSF